jgi:hypothetical protein
MKVLFRAAFIVFAIFLSVASAKDKDKVPALRAKLIGFQEVPSVSTVASGEFHARINPGDTSIDYELTYSGLQGDVTQAHIHIGQRSVNGGIVLWFCGTNIGAMPTPGPSGTPTCTNGSGTFTGTFTSANVQAISGGNVSQQVSAGEFAKVIAAIRGGVAYANVHTTLSTGGEIRGQIKVVGPNDDDDED